MIRISPSVSLAEWEVSERFLRAGGPGGQNVNKVSTAVELRFEAARSPNLTPAVKARLRRLAGRRWTKEGAIILRADQHRTQAMNRAEAVARLTALIQAALIAPKPRIATQPSRAAKRRRIEAKRRQGAQKALRRDIPED